MISSTPNVFQFDPREIEWQYELITDIRQNFDYKLGTHEALLSGSVGSGKSLPGAHIAITHCLLYPGANYGIGRRALPQLKATALRKVKEHLFNSGVDYKYNESSGDFKLVNGSRITAFSWADGNYAKMGSYELSSGQIEEAQENKEPKAAEYMLSRIGRLPHVPEWSLLYLANPDSPGHWLAKRFNLDARPLDTFAYHPQPQRHVYFSRTEQNKFLAPAYIEGLKQTLDPKLARRLLYGEWVEINTDRIYHAYESSRNFKRDEDYKVNPRFPIHLSWDFNIAKGKPLSLVMFQYIDGVFHFFDEVIVEGIRTEDSLEEASSRGVFEHKCQFIINGDAAGKNSDTRSNRSDYDIIKKYLAQFRRKDGTSLSFEQEVPLANPPLRKRHNEVNARCLNALGEVRLFVYKRCKILDEGMRLTQLKDGANYIEDDSKPYQHCTTALGYGVIATLKKEDTPAPSVMRRL